MSEPRGSENASWVRDRPGDDETLEENWLFRLRRERFRSRYSGLSHQFYVLHLADAVNVIALTPDQHLVLVRQFRAGSGHDSLETPGGLVEPNEDPIEAGVRELLEETGFVGEPRGVLGTVWSNPSIMTSRTVYIVVENARRVAAPRPDQNEEVVVELVPRSAIPRMIAEGRINHALVVCGLLWWIQSQFPGALAKARPNPRRRLSISSLMIAVAAAAIALWFIREPIVLVVVAIPLVIATFYVMAGWTRS